MRHKRECNELAEQHFIDVHLGEQCTKYCHLRKGEGPKSSIYGRKLRFTARKTHLATIKQTIKSQNDNFQYGYPHSNLLLHSLHSE